ncbi:hypothetical protein HYY75_03370 [bacterium]|nr:hypothetical protein [bacterium]
MSGSFKTFALYIKSTLQSSEEGENSGFIAVCRDITAEKEIDRMKNEFVSQVSHELRTPLTSIQAYTEMLLDEEVSNVEKQKDYLKIIYGESERLTRLINELLDIARIESGKRLMKLISFDLKVITRSVVQVLSTQAAQKNISITFPEPENPVVFNGDEDLIKQVGLNLLSNAIKYTPSGGKVEIMISSIPQNKIAWKFQDTGIGLTSQEKERIFTKFFRADSDFVRAAGGTGLGLTLVRHIVELKWYSSTIPKRA